MSNSVTGHVGNAKKNQNDRGVKGSKYKQKQAKGAKKTDATAKQRDERAPVFLYTSECCGELAKKAACIIDRGVKFEERKASLGHWRCSQCRRACKVTRKVNKDGVIPFKPAQTIKEVASSLSLPTLLALTEALVPGSVERILNGTI